jgi:hypothetical protein
MKLSNVGYREHLNLHGTLPLSEIEALVDRVEDIDSNDLSGIEIHINEAKAQFPDEDFLAEPIERLGELAKRLRGVNRETVESIVAELEVISAAQAAATEFAISEFKAAIKLIPKD